MQIRIPAVYMRGGTSKAVFFHQNHLPHDPVIRDQVILAAYGSPDPNQRQMDGMGGSLSTNSKAAIISPSSDPAYDVVYHFGQVSIDRPLVDYKGNCGNISAAVGPFAIDEGLVEAIEPVTKVRIYQKNTKKLIIAEVPVKGGRHDPAGDYAIQGVPGTGSRINLRFDDPAGSVTGRFFPTGNPLDTIDIPQLGEVKLTIIDAGNPWVLVPATELGLLGTEIAEIDRSLEIRQKLEAIRSTAAVLIGLASSPAEASQRSQSVPKIAFLSAPRQYETLDGKTIKSDQIDMVARVMSMGVLHKALAVSCAIAAAGAAAVEGTIMASILDPAQAGQNQFRLGHPGGIFEVRSQVKKNGNSYEYVEASFGRTARRLMEGYVLVPEECFNKL
jgi:2-methylaconitate cis-trans-isomerase PrpF